MPQTYLTIQDLTSVLLCITGVIALILVIICLFFVLSSLKRLDGILKKNETEINDVVKLLPVTLKKVDTTMGDIGEMTQAVKPAVINISGAIDATATTVNNINTNVLGKVVDLKWVFTILANIYAFVSDKFGKKKEKAEDEAED